MRPFSVSEAGLVLAGKMRGPVRFETSPCCCCCCCFFFGGGGGKPNGGQRTGLGWKTAKHPRCSHVLGCLSASLQLRQGVAALAELVLAGGRWFSRKVIKVHVDLAKQSWINTPACSTSNLPTKSKGPPQQGNTIIVANQNPEAAKTKTEVQNQNAFYLDPLQSKGLVVIGQLEGFPCPAHHGAAVARVCRDHVLDREEEGKKNAEPPWPSVQRAKPCPLSPFQTR